MKAPYLVCQKCGSTKCSRERCPDGSTACLDCGLRLAHREWDERQEAEFNRLLEEYDKVAEPLPEEIIAAKDRRIAELEEVLREYEVLEANLIKDGAAWDATSGVPQLSQEFCDEWATIQGHRCRLLNPEMYPSKQGGRGDE